MSPALMPCAMWRLLAASPCGIVHADGSAGAADVDAGAAAMFQPRFMPIK
jgi:hypothetical protein